MRFLISVGRYCLFMMFYLLRPVFRFILQLLSTGCLLAGLIMPFVIYHQQTSILHALGWSLFLIVGILFSACLLGYDAFLLKIAPPNFDIYLPM
ncbi:hypothetical protein [Photobacterium carnosum]|uniref:hypothetical protein n=1 Tax=Photobacterium carnosum TaxID=2023717 RepID=UPI001E28F166|nr:hypothetical protein [Photobacterium carnosum]